MVHAIFAPVTMISTKVVSRNKEGPSRGYMYTHGDPSWLNLWSVVLVTVTRPIVDIILGGGEGFEKLCHTHYLDIHVRKYL